MNSSSVKIFRHLSLYLASGLDILSALSLTLKRVRTRREKNALMEMNASLESGKSLADAFHILRRDNIVDSVAWSMILSSVNAGTLPACCSHVMEYARKSADMKASFAGSLAYPCAVLLSSAGMIYFLMAVIFPKITPLFMSLGMPLPLVTRVLFAASSLLRSKGAYALLLMLALACAGYAVYRRGEGGRLFLDRLLFLNPISTFVLMPREYYRVALSVSSLMKSGVTLHESLGQSSDASSLSFMRQAQERIRESIEAGKKVSESFESEPLFEHEWVHMLAAGEMSGSLPSVFNDLSIFYEKQFSDRLQLVARWSEPVALAVSAGVILAVALSVIQPMYAVIQFVHPV